MLSATTMAGYSNFNQLQAVDRHARDDAIRVVMSAHGPADPGRLLALAQAYLDQYYYVPKWHLRFTGQEARTNNCGLLLSSGLDVYQHIMSYLTFRDAYVVTATASRELRSRALPTICAGRDIGRVVTPEHLLSMSGLRATHLKWEYETERVPLPAWTTKLNMTYSDFKNCLLSNNFAYMQYIRELNILNADDSAKRRHMPITHGFNLSAALFPPKLEKLSLYNSFDEEIPVGCLPSTLRELVFRGHYNKPILHGALPDSLEVLDLRTMFSCSIAPGVLPATLRELYLGVRFNHALHEITSRGEISYVLPRNLKLLYIYITSDQTIIQHDLPQTLQTLTITGHTYSDRPYLKVPPLPPTITHLTLHYVDASGPNILPERLQVLSMFAWSGQYSNWINDKNVPNLKELYIRCLYNNFLSNPPPLPQRLKILHIDVCEDFIPPSALRNIDMNFKAIPPSVTNLTISGDFNQKILPGDLPQNLTYLKVSSERYEHQFDIGDLPTGLQELVIEGKGFKRAFQDGALPATLKSLDVSKCYIYGGKDKPIGIGVLPASLLHLRCNYEYGMSTLLEKRVLPNNLQTLTICGNKCNAPLHDLVLPDSLRELHLGAGYRKPVDPNVLPGNLEVIYIGFGFITNKGAPPQSLQKIIVNTQKKYAHNVSSFTYMHKYVMIVHRRVKRKYRCDTRGFKSPYSSDSEELRESSESE
jgi:hypothetical protein